MILEVVIAQHRLWRHVLVRGAHTCLPIPTKGIIAALHCKLDNSTRTAIDDVAYSIRNDQKVPTVTLGDLYYPYTTIYGVYDVVCGALYPRAAKKLLRP
jgi:hypothetical protein